MDALSCGCFYGVFRAVVSKRWSAADRILLEIAVAAQQVDEEAADNGTMLEHMLRAGLGLIEVGQRYALNGFGYHFCNAGMNHVPILGIVGENGCPCEPVKLGEETAAIQRYTILFALFGIERDFSFIELFEE